MVSQVGGAPGGVAAGPLGASLVRRLGHGHLLAEAGAGGDGEVLQAVRVQCMWLLLGQYGSSACGCCLGSSSAGGYGAHTH